MMQALDKDLRKALETTVKAARTVAETAAYAAVEQLGVGHDKPEAFLSDTEKALRNRLRTHGKQLGDARDSKSTNPTYGKQEVRHLVQEVAYQHWHRMLFARFLADNNLLMYDGVAVTIEECDELAPDEGAKSGWELAGKLAARMLPQVFKPGSPVFELIFASEHQSVLERLLKDLPDTVFKASDSLGWVYQFWQADNKKRINESEVKIGADELPAVTQLFTEPYMVAFLLHNSLGAWWATRHPGKPCPVNLDYFRTLEDGTPAAGKCEGWPNTLAEFKLLDPCCGSGHFLVAAFLMLVPMRMKAEGLSAKEAVNRVLAENIHGLEIDPRCVEIAVFAVALEAWRYPDASGKLLGVREIPAPNIACCGLKVAAKAKDWEELVPYEASNVEYVRQELRQLHASFSDAPLLGSLLDPIRSIKNDLATSSYESLATLLRKALATERKANQINEEDDRWDLAISARGLLEAAHILTQQFHLICTNPPYLSRGGYSDDLKKFIDASYPDGKADLSTAMALRCKELLLPLGMLQLVMPQNFLFQFTYKDFRKFNLEECRWQFLAILGEKAFESPQAAGAFVCLWSVENIRSKAQNSFRWFDASTERTPADKDTFLKSAVINQFLQHEMLNNSDHVFAIVDKAGKELFGLSADCYQGTSTGDNPKTLVQFWEVSWKSQLWASFMTPPSFTDSGQGREFLVRKDVFSVSSDSAIRGREAWGKKGVLIGKMRNLPATIYDGGYFSNTAPVIIPKNKNDLRAIWDFCSSSEFNEELRKINPNVAIENGYVSKLYWNKEKWMTAKGRTSVATHSNLPTQWIFHGHPQPSTNPLQVAVARLLGYTWPAEIDDQMELSDDARNWISHSETLASHADVDGIVCIPPVSQDPAASDRLMNLLAAAYGEDWSNDILAQLLTAADHAGKSLETWLRDKFFTQHCALFGNRPFIWHVWDGLSDGFAALVNYHKLDYKTLESLTYTYLGDWIIRQKRDIANSVDGAQEKLAAAEALKKRLELILAGEAPSDIFVRWKPIEEQPIGWNPDLNDGVRINIRPFVLSADVKVKDAGVLRDRVTDRDPKTKELKLWSKDRGGDVPSAPWYALGLQYGGKVGDRINDHHLMLAEKRAARAKKGTV